MAVVGAERIAPEQHEAAEGVGVRSWDDRTMICI